MSEVPAFARLRVEPTMKQSQHSEVKFTNLTSKGFKIVPEKMDNKFGHNVLSSLSLQASKWNLRLG